MLTNTKHLSINKLLPTNRDKPDFYSKVAELNANGELEGDETTQADISEEEQL
jgi:hypothetical protein